MYINSERLTDFQRMTAHNSDNRTMGPFLQFHFFILTNGARPNTKPSGDVSNVFRQPRKKGSSSIRR